MRLDLPLPFPAQGHEDARAIGLDVADGQSLQLRKARAGRREEQNHAADIAVLVIDGRRRNDPANKVVIEDLVLARLLVTGGQHLFAGEDPAHRFAEVRRQVPTQAPVGEVERRLEIVDRPHPRARAAVEAGACFPARELVLVQVAKA